MEKQTRIAGVMIGPIGAGKSVIGKKMAAEKGLKYIDPDEMWDRTKENYTPELANEIFGKAFGEIYKCIKSGKSFLLNTASKTHIARREFVRVVRAHNHGTPKYDFKLIGFFVNASLKTCLERNARRKERRSDQDVIDYYHAIQKELPDAKIDEYDELIVINNNDFNAEYSK
jgi:predicted ABC-type ATPase